MMMAVQCEDEEETPTTTETKGNHFTEVKLPVFGEERFWGQAPGVHNIRNIREAMVPVSSSTCGSSVEGKRKADGYNQPDSKPPQTSNQQNWGSQPLAQQCNYSCNDDNQEVYQNSHGQQWK